MANNYQNRNGRYSQSNYPQKKQSSGKAKLFALIIVLLLGYTLAPELAGSEAAEALLPLLAPLLIFVVISIIVASASKKKNQSASPARKTDYSRARKSTDSVVKAKKKETSVPPAWKVLMAKEDEEHTHDKLDTEDFDPNESPEEHYLKQLKGFLRAGIIEKDEYNMLVAKYKN